MNHAKPTDRLLFYFFVGLLVWLPLPKASVHPWAVSIMAVGSLSLISSWIVLHLTGAVKPNNTFKKSLPMLILLGITQAWVFLTLNGQEFNLSSSPLTLDAGRTNQQLIQGLGLLGIFACTLLLVRSRRRLKIVVFALIISGIAQAMYGSLMTLSGIEYGFLFPKEIQHGLVTGTFVNRNHFAGYMELCLAVGIGYMIATLKDDTVTWRDFSRRILESLLGSKARVRIGLMIMVVALVLTHSRMGNTAFFTSMSIAGAIALVLGKRASKSTTILLTSLIAIDLLIVGTFFGVEKVVDRLESTSMTTVKRDEVNQYALPLLEENLYTGTGAGSFYSVFPEHRKPELGSKPFVHTHNDYLQFAIEFGLIGFIPLLLAVVLTFITALRAQWRRSDPLMRGLSFACIMATISFGIHSTVDFNLQIPANAATFMVIMALGWISMYHKEGKRSNR